ncbi:hypothetical protein CP8484711_1029B, partial [Chlamydia psittaci 84-8471/1]
FLKRNTKSQKKWLL